MLLRGLNLICPFKLVSKNEQRQWYEGMSRE